ncbi:MAG: two-component system LytT family response regulator [Crocinitomicaceae bacterium]|jgi:two-component system LytT family response regulator
MKKAIIIDDEPLARTIVKAYLNNHEDIEVVAECNNGFEGIKSIEEHQPDLLFLDIQMPKINGFEMLELVDRDVSVIFTTAFDEYAINAFEASAIDYLLKPFTQERFDKSITKWKKSNPSGNTDSIGELINQQPSDNRRIVVKENGNIQIIPTEDILFIEAYDDYVKVHTKEKYYLKKKTMNYYENSLLKSTFIRIHRSYILNINKLTKIESFEKNSYRATLINGAVIPISRTSYSELKQILGL